jgi:hypothetical protein
MIQVKPTSLNLGTLQVNKSHKFSIEVVNTGASRVIVDTKPYCSSCTTAKVIKSHLNAGESTMINMVFTPTKLGDNHKIVGILANNEEVSKVVFQSNVIN